jgi:hypothetical protein
MARRRIVRRSVPSSARVLRQVCDSIHVSRIFAVDATDRAIIVPAANITGVRRIQDFTLKLSAASPLVYALVYVPEGINAEGVSLNISEPSAATSVYTPEQHIILSGVVSGDMYPARYFGSRNLASGDAVYLLTRAVDAKEAGALIYTVTYYIAFA